MTAHGKLTKALLAGGLILFCLVILYGMNMSELQKDINIHNMQGKVNYFHEFSMQTADGGTFTQDNLKDYQVTVMNGWGPWCPSCVAEMPDLQELYDEMEPDGVQIVGVVADYIQKDKGDGAYLKQINSKVSSLDITYPIPLADHKFTEEVYPTMHNAFPGTWILDSDGTIIGFYSGGKSKSEWKQIIDDALQQTGGKK